MRRFIKKILILFVPILLIVVTMEVLLRKIPNDYAFKNEHFYNKRIDADLLILGNSYALYGLNPSYFNEKTINLAHVSQSLNLDLLLLEKYLKKNRPPKQLILPISCLTFYSNLEKDTEKWRMKDYVLYYGFQAKDCNNYSEVFSVPFKENISVLYRYYVKNKSKIRILSNGFSDKYNTVFMPNELVKINKTIKYHKSLKRNNYEENQLYLEKITSICKKKKVQLIFVTMPITECYKKEMNSEIIKLRKLITTYSKQHKIKFVDLAKSRYKNAYFYDLDHLNLNGAKLISKQLNDSI